MAGYLTCPPQLGKNDVAAMRMSFLRPLLALVATLYAALAFGAGTLTVTSPTTNDFLGKSNTVSFNITGATVKVTVKAVATAPNGTTTPVQTDVTPDSDGKASGSLPLTFNESAPEGSYTILVTAEEPGNTYASRTISVTVDVVAPKFLEISPVSGGYTKGLIKIRASVLESNIDRWTVTVNGQTVGTGAGSEIAADFDPTGLPNDGAQNISVQVFDKAKNSSSKSISITLDRVKPTAQIVYPTSNTRISSGQDVTVLVDVSDASATSVDKTGIDVIAKRTDGSFITRITLVSLKGTNGITQRWTGRIRYKKGQLPSRFVISVNVLDRAGNVATLQEVTARYGK